MWKTSLGYCGQTAVYQLAITPKREYDVVNAGGSYEKSSLTLCFSVLHEAYREDFRVIALYLSSVCHGHRGEWKFSFQANTTAADFTDLHTLSQSVCMCGGVGVICEIT